MEHSTHDLLKLTLRSTENFIKNLLDYINNNKLSSFRSDFVMFYYYRIRPLFDRYTGMHLVHCKKDYGIKTMVIVRDVQL